MKAKLAQYIKENAQNVYELTKELCKIPAPSFKEEKRAAFCAQWMRDNGYPDAYVDEALNAICTIGVEEDNEVVLLIAHIDTVFDDMEPYPMREEDGKLYCPGANDNTCHVAMLLYAAKFFKENNSEPNVGIVFSANSGEEAKGSKGITQLMKDFDGRVREVVSFDGVYDFIYDAAMGSKSFEVTITTEGGHSYNHFGNRNAIHVAASIINTLYNITLPKDSGMSYNAGTITGGAMVNAIAQSCKVKFEYRAIRKEDLEWLDKMFSSIIDAHRYMCQDIAVEHLGGRGLEGNVDKQKQAVLAKKAWDVVYSVFGEEPKYRAGATDCGVPLSMSVPAVCFGSYDGGGAHSRGEWLDIASVPTGFEIVMQFIALYFEE